MGWHGHLTRYEKLRTAHAPGKRERFPAHHRLQRKPLVSDPGMHHGTCVTHMPWCMSGLLNRGGGENVPDIPGACSTLNFTYPVRGLWLVRIRTIIQSQWQISEPDKYQETVKESRRYYNMTVWHFGPCVTFWPCLCDISARLVWHFGPLVRNEGKRVSPYPHINHWRRL